MGAFGMARSRARTLSRPEPLSLGRRVFSVAAMSFVVLLIVGVSIPANAFGTSSSGTASGSRASDARTQAVSVSGEPGAASVAQDGFAVTLPVVLPKVASASGAGEPRVSGVSFIAAPGPVLWPTDVSPTIGHGVTDSHHGQDLLMAGGTPVHAIADGTVSVSTTEGSLGTYVVVESSIGGHSVTSLYAHLQSQSVGVGDVVTQGQTVGLVGSSGAATANLLYLRILQDGALCDTITYIAGNPAGGAAPH